MLVKNDVHMLLESLYILVTLRFLCLNVRKVSLVDLAMQMLSSEATISCRNRDAPALPEQDQRAVISFF